MVLSLYLFIFLEKRDIIPVYFSLYPVYANRLGGAKSNALQFPIFIILYYFLVGWTLAIPSQNQKDFLTRNCAMHDTYNSLQNKASFCWWAQLPEKFSNFNLLNIFEVILLSADFAYSYTKFWPHILYKHINLPPSHITTSQRKTFWVTFVNLYLNYTTPIELNLNTHYLFLLLILLLH